MFDTLSRPRPRSPAAGTAVSIAIHALVIGGALWLTTQKVYEPVNASPPIVRPGPPKGAPPAGPRSAASPPKHRKKPRPPLVQPSAAPAPAPEPAARPEVAEEPALEEEVPAAPGEVIGGVPGGDPHGVPGGGAVPGIEVPPAPRPFEDGRMTPPERISGPDPAYTPQALEHEIEGTMAVRCVVTEQGIVRGCRVLRSLPYMDAAVIEALEHRRYRPASIDGRPVAVDYLFQVRLRLP